MDIKTGTISELPIGTLKREGKKPKYENIYSLRVDGFIEIGSYELWKKMRQAAHTYGSREGKKFKAKWCNQRAERAERMEESNRSTAGMDTNPRGFIWRVK